MTTEQLERPRVLAQENDAPRARMETDAAILLGTWRYVEYSALRILAGWGRNACEWDDKMAMCHHVWLQAEIVDRMRARLAMFPGRRDGEAPVSEKYETLCNAVLLAPSWRDAMAGLYEVLQPALVAAYEKYRDEAHPIHDLPTLEILRETLAMKAQQADWYKKFAAANPHQMPREYSQQIREALAQVGALQKPLTAQAPFAATCGVNTDFRMNATAGRPRAADKAPFIMPFLEADWNKSVETRRLFFMIGYFFEMLVAETQLRWIYSADFMPWDFIYAEARHMWDESRHGDSGLARLRDFGLDIGDIGYGAAWRDEPLPPLSPRDLYEDFYLITQIGETGYFKTKGYCYEDFRDGDDLASAEMMKFDIIDETSHVEYGRIWLEELARRAGAEEDTKSRAHADRIARQKGSDERAAAYQRVLATGEIDEKFPQSAILLDGAARAHYEKLLRILREQKPLSNAATAPLRPNLPM